MRKQTILILAAVLALLALASGTGCRRVLLPENERVSTTKAHALDETASVALGDATSLDATVRMGVGTLSLSAAEPSSTLALSGGFKYAPASWKPDVNYSVEGTSGKLSVAQPEMSSKPDFGRSENTWDLRLPQGVPTKLSLKLGVGESTIDLHKIDLTGLEMTTGVGKSTIDISGPRAGDLSARIEAGIGEVDITVPRNVGVTIIGGKDGLGDLKADGFTDSGGEPRNAAWNQSGPKIELTLNRGIGEVKITQVP